MTLRPRAINPDKGKGAESHTRAHRNRLAGMWAAELLGLIGHAAKDYVRHLSHPEMVAKDDAHMVETLTKDLKGKVGAQEIKEKLIHFLHLARHHPEAPHQQAHHPDEHPR